MSYNCKNGVPVFSLFQALFFHFFKPNLYDDLYDGIYMTGLLWRDSDDAPSNDAYGDLVADIVDFCGAEAPPDHRTDPLSWTKHAPESQYMILKRCANQLHKFMPFYRADFCGAETLPSIEHMI